MYNGNNSDNIDNSECDYDSENKIKIRLLDIQNQFDLDNLDLGFYDRKIKMTSISLHQAQERLDVYKNIAKLGIYIINDYDFFFKVAIPSAFKNELYNTAMQNLGYQRTGSSWNLMYKPAQDVIIDFIYKYCYYSYIVAMKNNQKMKYNTPKRENYPKKNFNSENNQSNKRYNNQAQLYHSEYSKNTNRKENQFNNARSHDAPQKKEVTIEPRNLYGNDNGDMYEAGRPAKKPEAPVRNAALPNTFKCDLCESINPLTNNKCQVCEHPASKLGKWHCPKCTYINEANSVNCDVCQHVNVRRI